MKGVKKGRNVKYPEWAPINLVQYHIKEVIYFNEELPNEIKEYQSAGIEYEQDKDERYSDFLLLEKLIFNKEMMPVWKAINKRRKKDNEEEYIFAFIKKAMLDKDSEWEHTSYTDKKELINDIVKTSNKLIKLLKSSSSSFLGRSGFHLWPTRESKKLLEQINPSENIKIEDKFEQTEKKYFEDGSIEEHFKELNEHERCLYNDILELTAEHPPLSILLENLVTIAEKVDCRSFVQKNTSNRDRLFFIKYIGNIFIHRYETPLYETLVNLTNVIFPDDTTTKEQVRDAIKGLTKR